MAAFPSRRSVLSVSRLPTIGKREKLFEWTTTAFPSRRRHGGGLLGVMYDRINEKDRNAHSWNSSKNPLETVSKKGREEGKEAFRRWVWPIFQSFPPRWEWNRVYPRWNRKKGENLRDGGISRGIPL